MKRVLIFGTFLLLFFGILIPFYVAHSENLSKNPQPTTKESASNADKNNADKKTENTKDSTEEEKISQKQTLGFFHSVILYGVGNLYITQSDETNFTIEAEPKILALMNAYVKNQVLHIEMKNASDYTQAKVNYYLKLKTLQSITTYAASSIYIKNGFEAKILNIALLSGFGEAFLNVDVTKLTTKIMGAGKIDIQGVADELQLSINGIGEFTGNKLKTKLANINIQGSGIAKLNVSEDLMVNLRGNGIVQYCGKPNITKDIEGKGIVSPLDANQCQ